MATEEKHKDDTYELIINTAKKLFFKEGKFHATTQEIADAAGVNRTLINYYFRSRNALFDLVFEEAKKEDEKRQEMIVLSDLPVREKLEQFIDYFFEQAKKYPYREIYMVTQMTRDEFSACYHKKEHISKLTSKFYVELEQEMEKGTIQKMNPIQFTLNLVALLVFPVSMRPFLKNSFDLDDTEYDKLLSERKEVILKTIFKNE
ncbi:MAG TPA: TetR/AcrR family transcriptional regulator [Flavobacteriaceae bacterium]|nr:TetR/AcrR family transcriptional regulator [Flavobacteriaceae bacterium]